MEGAAYTWYVMLQDASGEFLDPARYVFYGVAQAPARAAVPIQLVSVDGSTAVLRMPGIYGAEQSWHYQLMVKERATSVEWLLGSGSIYLTPRLAGRQIVLNPAPANIVATLDANSHTVTVMVGDSQVACAAHAAQADRSASEAKEAVLSIQVDQSYQPASPRAQSGKAVAAAVARSSSSYVKTLGESIMVGSGSLGVSSVEVGMNHWAAGNGVVCIGVAASAYNSGVSVGWGASAGEDSTVVGKNAYGVCNGSIAIGFEAESVGVRGLAVGARAGVKGDSGTAIGANAKAMFPHATALGAGAINTERNCLAIGVGSREKDGIYTQIYLGVDEQGAYIAYATLDSLQDAVVAGKKIYLDSLPGAKSWKPETYGLFGYLGEY